MAVEKLEIKENSDYRHEVFKYIALLKINCCVPFTDNAPSLKHWSAFLLRVVELKSVESKRTIRIKDKITMH